jgi:hypothetical protein
MKARPSSFLKKLYNLYNEKFFDNKLPHDTILCFVSKLDNVKCKKNLHRRTCAVTRWYDNAPIFIFIRRTKDKSLRYIISDLLHEMVHIARPNASCNSEGVYDGAFQQEMQRLARDGAFNAIW